MKVIRIAAGLETLVYFKIKKGFSLSAMVALESFCIFFRINVRLDKTR